MVLLVFRYMGEGDDDVLVDEDEQCKEETQPDRTQCVQSRELFKWWEVEDGAIVDTEDWN